MTLGPEDDFARRVAEDVAKVYAAPAKARAKKNAANDQSDVLHHEAPETRIGRDTAPVDPPVADVADGQHDEVDPLRDVFAAVSAADGPFAKLEALTQEAKKVAFLLRHGLQGLDYPEARAEVEERLIHLAESHELIKEFTRGTVEGGIVAALNTPALSNSDPPPNGGSQNITPLLRSSAEFIAGFKPPDYLLDGILQRRFIYSFTARTGGGKSAVALLLTASVALGQPIGGREVQKGRALYFAGENPDDIRMRWIAEGQHMGFDPEQVDVYFIAGTFKISEMAQRIAQEIEGVGAFDLIVVDTSAVYFEDDDENSNTQAGVHARRLRGLVSLPGEPSVVVLCHPTKHAKVENLLPRGGGAFIAEMDGNLTATNVDGVVTVYWEGKFRGPDFAPITFQLKTVTHERLNDSRGRLIPTVIAVHLSEDAQEEIAALARSDENLVLAEIVTKPDQSYAQIAQALGWKVRDGSPHKVKVLRCVEKSPWNAANRSPPTRAKRRSDRCRCNRYRLL
jgi:AAA domain